MKTFYSEEKVRKNDTEEVVERRGWLEASFYEL